MMVDHIRIQELWKAWENKKDLCARLKSALIQVEIIKAFRPNLKAINRIELLKKYERQRYNLGIYQSGLFQSAWVILVKKQRNQNHMHIKYIYTYTLE